MKNLKQSTSNKIRVRFAPSPTGYLHVGGARTALYNYLFAKKNKGSFVIRVEDTDEARSTRESLESMLSDLSWMGLSWDEGPQAGSLTEHGEHGPYFQSERKHIYKDKLEELLLQGKAYHCFLTEEELDLQREEAKKKGEPFRPKSPYRDWSVDEAKARIAKGDSPTIRFRNDHGEKAYSFTDLVRGEVALPSSMIGDFVVARSNGMPVYNFVCAIDDALMEISHVFRAEEHLNNTLRQLMILEALNLPAPQFGHLSIMLGSDKQKLSKRHGAASLDDFKSRGFLPQALMNFIALMGWSSPSGEEIISLDQMIEEFTTDRLNPASAVFDEEKLKWMNAQYLRSMESSDFWKHMGEFLDKNWEFPVDESWRARVFEALKTSMETFVDGVELFQMLKLGGDLSLNDKAQEVLSWESTPRVLQEWKALVGTSSEEYIGPEKVDEYINEVKSKAEVKGKFLFMPIRVASIGRAQGTEIKELIPLIPSSELVLRSEKLLSL